MAKVFQQSPPNYKSNPSYETKGCVNLPVAIALMGAVAIVIELAVRRG